MSSDNPSPQAEAPPTSTPLPRWRRLRRTWKWLWRGTVVLLLVAYLSRNHWLGPWLLHIAEQKLATELGCAVELEGLSGSWIGGIGLTLARTSGEPSVGLPLRGFQVEGFSAQWSLWKWLRGKPDWFTVVRVQHLGLSLRSTPDPTLGKPQEATQLRLPEALPQIEVDRIDLHWADPIAEIQLVGGHLTTLADAQALAAWELRAPEIKVKPQGGEELRVDLSGQLKASRQESDGAARFDHRLQLNLGPVGTAAPAQLSLAGTWTQERLSTSLDLTDLQAAWAEPWIRQGWAGTIEAHGQVELNLTSLLDSAIDLQLGSSENQWQKVHLDAVRGRVELADRHLRIPALKAQGPGLEWEVLDLELPLPNLADAQAWAPDQAVGDARLRWQVDDLRQWLQRTGRADELGPLANLPRSWSGDLHLGWERGTVALVIDRFDAASSLGKVELAGSARLSFAETRGPRIVDQDLTLRWTDLDLATAATQFPQLASSLPATGSGEIELRMAGPGTAPEITAALQVTGLTPPQNSPAAWSGDGALALQGRLQGKEFLLEEATFGGDRSWIQAQGSWPLSLDVDALLRGESLEIPAWQQAKATMKLNLRGAEWAIVGLPPEVPWTSAGLRAELALVDGRLQVDHAEGGVNGARLAISGHMSLESGNLDIAVRSEDFSGLSWLAPLIGRDSASFFPTQGATETKLHLEGPWSAPSLDFTASGRDWQLPPGSLAAPDPGPINLDLTVRHHQGRTTLEGFQVEATGLEVGAEGVWTHPLDLLALAGGSALEPGVVELVGRWQVKDLSMFDRLPGIRRLGGSADGKIRLEGPPGSWQFGAEGSWTKGELRLDDPSLGAFENLELHARWQDDQIRIGPFTGELGAAPFAGSGTIDLAAPEGPTVDLELSGDDLLWMRQPGVKLRGDVGLHLHGTWPAIRVEGDLALSDGRYVKPVDFFLPLLQRGQTPARGQQGLHLFSLTPPLDRMEFDLGIHPGNGFRVRTNVANGMVRPDLRLVGKGDVPYLLGEVYLDQFLFQLPSHRIRLDNGVVRFEEANPFDPSLDLQAGFRRFGYDVTIGIEGTLSRPVVLLQSTPPLDAEELLLFVTTGQPPQDELDAEAALGTVAVYLAQDWIRRFLGDDSTEADESLADRIEIEFGRDASNRGAETIEGRFLIRRDNFLPSDALYLTGERDAYGDFNLGLRIRFQFR